MYCHCNDNPSIFDIPTVDVFLIYRIDTSMLPHAALNFDLPWLHHLIYRDSNEIRLSRFKFDSSIFIFQARSTAHIHKTINLKTYTLNLNTYFLYLQFLFILYYSTIPISTQTHFRSKTVISLLDKLYF